MGNANGREDSSLGSAGDAQAPSSSFVSKRAGKVATTPSEEEKRRSSMERFEPFKGVPSKSQHRRKRSSRSGAELGRQAAASAATREQRGEQLIRCAESPGPQSFQTAMSLLTEDRTLWRYARRETSPKKVARHTVVHAAAACGNLELLSLLLQHGADPNFDPLGLSVPPLVALLWSVNDLELSSATAVATALLEAKADATLRLFKVEGQTRTLFHRALATPLRDAFTEFFGLQDVADALSNDELEEAFVAQQGGPPNQPQLQEQLRMQKEALKHNVGIRAPQSDAQSREGLFRDIRETAAARPAGEDGKDDVAAPSGMTKASEGREQDAEACKARPTPEVAPGEVIPGGQELSAALSLRDTDAAERVLEQYPQAWRFETMLDDLDQFRMLSCFHFAAFLNQPSLIRKILASGAPVDYLSTSKRTPLFEAVLKQNIEIVLILLENGANPNFRCAAGYPPIFDLVRGVASSKEVPKTQQSRNWVNSVDYTVVDGEIFALGPPPGRRVIQNPAAHDEIKDGAVMRIITALKNAGADLDAFDYQKLDTALLRSIRQCVPLIASCLVAEGCSLAIPVDGRAIIWHLFTDSHIQVVAWVLASMNAERAFVLDLFRFRGDPMELEKTYLEMVDRQNPNASGWRRPFEYLEYLCTDHNNTILTFRAQYSRGKAGSAGKWVTIQVAELSFLLRYGSLESFLYRGTHPGVSSLIKYYAHRPIGEGIYNAAQAHGVASFACASSLACIFVRSAVETPIPLASLQPSGRLPEAKLRSIFLQILVAMESTTDACIDNEHLTMESCFIEQDGSNLCINLMRGADLDTCLMAPEIFLEYQRLLQADQAEPESPATSPKPSKKVDKGKSKSRAPSKSKSKAKTKARKKKGPEVAQPKRRLGKVDMGCLPLSAYVFSAGGILMRLLGAPLFVRRALNEEIRVSHWDKLVRVGVATFLQEARVQVSHQMEDLLMRVLLPEAAERLALEDILQHPWLSGCPVPQASASLALRAAQKEPQLPLRSTRFNIVGTARAGKTSFFKAMKGEPFDPFQASTRAGEAEEVRTAANEADIGAELTQARVEGDCVWVEITEGKDADYELALRQEAARRVGRRHKDPMGGVSGDSPTTDLEDEDEDDAPGPMTGVSDSASKAPAEAADLTGPSEEAPLPGLEEQAAEADAEAGFQDSAALGDMYMANGGTINDEDDDAFPEGDEQEEEEDRAERLEDLAIELGEHDHLSLSVFDFGGQRIFQCMQNLFLSRFGVYAVAFNLEDMLRSSSRPYDDLNYWLRALQIYAPRCPVVILATHKDTVLSSLAPASRSESGPSNSPDGPSLQKLMDFCTRVSEKIEARFSQELLGNVVRYTEPTSATSLVFHPLSSRNVDAEGKFAEDGIFPTLRTRVKELAITDKTTDPASGMQVPFVDQRLPVSWLKTADALSELSHGTKIMSILREDRDAGEESSVEDIAELHGVFKAGDDSDVRLEKMKLMLRRLHQIARVFFHEHGPPELRKKVLLDPQWLLDSFSRICRDFDLHPLVLDVEAERNEPESWVDLIERGILHRKLLPYLWGDSRYRFYDFLIAFLRQQALLVAINDDDSSFLVPHLVSDLRSFTSEAEAMTVFNTSAWDDDGLDFYDSSDEGTDEEEVPDEPLVVAYYEFPEWLPRGFYERVIVKTSEKNASSGWPTMQPGSATVPSATGGILGLQTDPSKPSVIKVALRAADYRFDRDVKQGGAECLVASRVLQDVEDVMAEVNQLYYAATLSWQLWVLNGITLSFVPAKVVSSLEAEDAEASSPEKQRFRDEREPLQTVAKLVPPTPKPDVDDCSLSPAQISFRDFLKESLMLSEACLKVVQFADKMQQRYRYISNLLQEFRDEKVSESDLISVYGFDEAEAGLFLRHVQKVLDRQSDSAIHVNAWFGPGDAVAREECESVHTTIMNSSCLGVTCHAAPFPFLEECGNKIKRSRCKILHIAAHAGEDGCLKIPVDEDEPDEFAEPEELADCWEACIRPPGDATADSSRPLECVILNNCHGRALALGLAGAAVVFWDSKANEQAAKKFAKLFHKECATSNWNFLAAFEDACTTMSMRWDVNKNPNDYPSGKVKDGSSKRAKKVAGLLRFKSPDGRIFARENRKLVQISGAPSSPAHAPQVGAPKGDVEGASPPPPAPVLQSDLSKTWSRVPVPASNTESTCALLLQHFTSCLPPLVRENSVIVQSLTFKRVAEMSIKSMDKGTRKRFATYSHAIHLGRLNIVKQQLQQTGGSITFTSFVSSIVEKFQRELSAQQSSGALTLPGRGTSGDDVELLGKRLILCVRLDVPESPDANMLGYKLLWLARPVLALHTGLVLQKLFDECVKQMQILREDPSWTSSASEAEDATFETAIKTVVGDEQLRFHQVRSVHPRRDREIRGILDFARLFVGRLTSIHLSGEDDNQASLAPAEWDIETVFQFLKVRAFARDVSSSGGVGDLREADVQSVYKFRNTVMHQNAVTQDELESLVQAVQRIMQAVAISSPALVDDVRRFEASLQEAPTATFVKDSSFKEFCLQFNASVNAQLEDLQTLAKENLQLTKHNTTLAEETAALQRRALAIMDIDNEIRRCNEGLDWCSREMKRAVSEYSNALLGVDLTERDEWRLKIDGLAEKTRLLNEQKQTLEQKRQKV